MNIRYKFATLGVRHTQVLFMFLLLTVAVGMRVQFSVAIVAMTDSTASRNPDIPGGFWSFWNTLTRISGHTINGGTGGDIVFRSRSVPSMTSRGDLLALTVYDWNNKSIILSSFFWGYALLQVLGAVMARKYGAKLFLIVSMGINSLLCCLIPIVARELGSYGVMGCRTLMGLSQGFLYPSLYFILSNWIPASERAQMSSSALSGAPFGIISGMPITGFISASWAGWPCSFYFYGALGFLWVAGYYFLGASLPDEHPLISENEKNFIKSNIDNKCAELKVPWKVILSSSAFWAIFAVYIGQTWAYQTFLSELPIYMNKVMKFNMESNGILSAAPYLTMFIVMVTSGYIADTLINCNCLTVRQTRRLFCMIACLTPAISLIILSFLSNEAVTLCVAMLILAVGISGASAGSFDVSYMDISPNFAGILMGICNSSGELFSIFGPMAIQLIVTDETNKAQWRIIFLTASVCYFLVCGIYVILVKTDIQPWNNVDPTIKNGTEKKELKNEISVIKQPIQ